jgi:hypothetical protein
MIYSRLKNRRCGVTKSTNTSYHNFVKIEVKNHINKIKPGERVVLKRISEKIGVYVALISTIVIDLHKRNECDLRLERHNQKLMFYKK